MKPDFIIIGAMKCGTTTLFRDLSKHPAIFAPGNKEPEVLLRDVAPEQHASDYAEVFSGDATDQLKGEASTAYTKRPDIDGIPNRAMALCGNDLRIIYLRRDPVARIVSHYGHAREHKMITVPFSDALRKHPELLAYTRYDWQLEPWRQTFGDQAIKVLDLEDYSANRQERFSDVVRFLGLSRSQMPAVNLKERANTAGEAKTVHNSLLRAVIYSDFYKNRVKTLFSDEFRARIRKTVLPAPEHVDVVVSEADRAFIEKCLSPSPLTAKEPTV